MYMYIYIEGGNARSDADGPRIRAHISIYMCVYMCVCAYKCICIYAYIYACMCNIMYMYIVHLRCYL